VKSVNGKRFWLYAVLLLALAVAFVLGARSLFQFVSERNRERALEDVSGSIANHAWQKAHRELEFYRARYPDDVELMAEQARFLTILSSRQAPEAWERVLQQRPENLEYRRAWILALLQSGRIDDARRILDAWDLDAQSGAPYLAAKLAVAFAEGNNAAALNAAKTLRELEPEARGHQLNLAKLDLMVNPQSKDARRQLWELTAHEETRFEALKALVSNVLQTQDHPYADRLLEELESDGMAPRNDPEKIEERFLELEFRQRLNRPVSELQLKALWEPLSNHLGRLYRLVGLMNASGRADLVVEWLGSGPDPAYWEYPLGFALAESGLAAGQEAWVTRGLKDSNWGSQEALRKLALARAAPLPRIQTILLESALSLCDGDENRIHGLLEISRIWGWDTGTQFFLRAIGPESTRAVPALRAWMRDLEQNGRTRGLLMATELQLDWRPEDPIGLNNAAYIKALLNEDLASALQQVQKARRLRPDIPGIRTTEGMVLARTGRTDEAQTILDGLPESQKNRGSGLLLQALILEGGGGPAGPGFAPRLRQAQFAWPEERSIQEKFLNN